MTFCGKSAFAVAIGAKGTCPCALHMSANDPKRTLVDVDQCRLYSTKGSRRAAVD
jgi:hypothetical protein